MRAILVDLDSLQDTRFGVLGNHFPNIARSLLDDQYRWLNRTSDHVDGVDDDVFRTLYADRMNNPDKVLGNSPLTSIPAILSKHILAHSGSADAQFVGSRLRLHINTWPYQFTEEVTDIFVRTLATWLKGTEYLTEIKAVYLPPSALTPRYIMEMGYDVLYMYDLLAWINAQGEALIKLVLPTISLVTPRLMRNPDAEELKLIPAAFKGRDLFTTLTEELRYIIDLDFLDASYFSFVPVPTAQDLEDIETTMKELNHEYSRQRDAEIRYVCTPDPSDDHDRAG